MATTALFSGDCENDVINSEDGDDFVRKTMQEKISMMVN